MSRGRKLRITNYEKNEMFLDAAQCHRHEILSIIKAPVRAGHAKILIKKIPQAP